MTTTTLRDIWIYPLKSAAGVRLDAAEITERGLRHDRWWMVTNLKGHFLTQRDHPKMACIAATVDGDTMTLQAPDIAALQVPAFPDTDAQPRSTKVWYDVCAAQSMGAQAAAWLTEVLRTPCEMVYMPPSTERPVDPKYSPAGKRVGFADGYPFLLANHASLRELNTRLDAPVPMERFRPNLVVDTNLAWAEDSWKSLDTSTCRFSIVKPCSRCVIVNTDQRTGERGREPLRTLSGYRRVERAVVFGQNLVHDGGGILRVGDTLVIG